MAQLNTTGAGLGAGESQGAAAGNEEVSQDEIKSNIEELINQERVVIFSKESCPYCFDAKKVN